jgi:amino-acid N-acetyltransferase
MYRSMGDGVFEIRPARPEDYGAVEALLKAAGLPLDGLSEHVSRALVARRGARIVGCVALEIHEGAALLRSLAVSEAERGQRLGERLAKDALGLARDAGAGDVYLLTETAVAFFPRFGFSVEDRSLAPAALQRSVEFLTACPASAVLMHAKVARA